MTARQVLAARAAGLCDRLHGHGHPSTCPRCRRLVDTTPWWLPLPAWVHAGSRTWRRRRD